MSDELSDERRAAIMEERHTAIMQEWVRRIVSEIAHDIAAGIVAEVGDIFLKAKEGNFRMIETMDQRLKVLEAALKARKR